MTNLLVMFPAWEEEAICDVLTACDENMEAACEMIMMWTVDDTKVQECGDTHFVKMQKKHQSEADAVGPPP
jgi:hypothetical protein